MRTLRWLCKKYINSLWTGKVLVLQDIQGHYSVLYKANDRVAHQFQNGFSPIVYPTPKYKVIDLLSVWELDSLRKIYNILPE